MAKWKRRNKSHPDVARGQVHHYSIISHSAPFFNFYFWSFSTCNSSFDHSIICTMLVNIKQYRGDWGKLLTLPPVDKLTFKLLNSLLPIDTNLGPFISRPQRLDRYFINSHSNSSFSISLLDSLPSRH